VYLLGGLQAIAELMQLDQELYGMQNEPINMALRRYAGMALTNLTYGDVVNKVNVQIIAYKYGMGSFHSYTYTISAQY